MTGKWCYYGDTSPRHRAEYVSHSRPLGQRRWKSPFPTSSWQGPPSQDPNALRHLAAKKAAPDGDPGAASPRTPQHGL